MTAAGWLATSVAAILAAGAQAAQDGALSLAGEVAVRCEADSPAVALATADLLGDLERVLGRPARSSDTAAGSSTTRTC